jgi:hypothetical protein
MCPFSLTRVLMSWGAVAGLEIMGHRFVQRFLGLMSLLAAGSRPQTRWLASLGVLSLYRAHLPGRSRVEYDDWRALSFGAVALVDPINGELISDFEAVLDEPPRSP